MNTFLPEYRRVSTESSVTGISRIAKGLICGCTRYTKDKSPLYRVIRLVTAGNGDIVLNLNINEYTQCGYYFGFPNPELRQLLRGGGGSFLDVGANIGLFSLYGAKYFKRVLAFEPSPSTYKALVQNIASNKASNILPFPLALSSKSERAFIHENPLNQGGNSLLPFSALYVKESGLGGWATHEVQTRPLDDVLKDIHLEQPVFMKIDVEGFEYEVLEGARETLQRYQPILFVEATTLEAFLRIRDALPPGYVAWEPSCDRPITNLAPLWTRENLVFSIDRPSP